jgi:hypothetical protein
MTEAASIAREKAARGVVPAPSTAAIASALIEPSATPVPNVSPDSSPAARMTGRIFAAIGPQTGARNSAIFDPAALAAGARPCRGPSRPGRRSPRSGC